MQHIIQEFGEQHFDTLGSFYTTLSNLTDSPLLDKERTQKILTKINNQGSKIFIAITPANEIIGSLTLLIEQKLTRGGVVAGHIEDVVTREGFEGNGIGKALMNAAIEEGKKQGCYKIILDCDNELAGYYEKFGFKNDGTFMRVYL